jgi:diacylglycerol kinase (ATP)
VTSLLVITNAVAGSTDAKNVDIAVDVLRRHADAEVVTTTTPQDCAAALARRQGRRVVVCGGDGSVHVVVAALHASADLADPIGIVPLGTGNDLARAVGLPLDPAAAARTALDGTPRALDVLLDDGGGLVVNAVHLGIGAEAARTATGLKSRLGRFAYVVGGISAGLREPGWRLRVEVDGRVLIDIGRRTLQVGIGIGTSVGGGSLLTPDAAPDDGLADVVVSAAVGPLARLLYGLRMSRGTHVGRRDVWTARGTTVSVAGESFWCNADGELQGPLRRRVWTVHPRAWRLLVPASARERAPSEEARGSAGSG